MTAGRRPLTPGARAGCEQAGQELRSVSCVKLPRGEPCRCRGVAEWGGPMQELDACAAQARAVIGLEIVDGFDLVRDWGLPRIGVTLHVGHLYLPTTRPALEGAGGIGALIRRLGTGLVHLHLHDTDGSADHIETGTGIVDFGAFAALTDIGYRRGMTLELNPSRSTAGGIGRSAAHVRALYPDREGRGRGPGPVTRLSSSQRR